MTTPSLYDISRVLKQARDAPDYNIGSPRALDHLLVHVLAAIEETDRRLDSLEGRAANLENVAP